MTFTAVPPYFFKRGEIAAWKPARQLIILPQDKRETPP
jgi:hypothetical protein